jgi:signal transduction histidine kinase
MWGLSRCSHPRIWTEEDIRLFQEIGTRIADSLSSLLLIRDLQEREEELRRRADELGALNRLGAGISAKLSAEETIRIALQEVHSSLAPDVAMLFLRDGEDLHLRGMFQGHTPKGTDVLPVHRVGECLCGLAVREGKSIFSYDIRSDPRCTWDECKRAGLVSCAAVPLAVGDEVIGTLAFASATPRDFEARSSFVEAFCHEVAISLKNSLLYEEVQSHAAALETRLIELQRAETEKEKLHEQLVQAQKMEAVGTLAGGIAHDFNNLLQVIVGYSDILSSARERTDRDSRALSAIRKAATDGAELVKGLLTFSRKGDTNPRPINLNHEIERIQEILQRAIPKMVDIELRLMDELKTVSADPTQIEQMLFNLALNAQHAMPDGGKFTIETMNVVLDKEHYEGYLSVEPGEYVQITVSDTGHGIEKEILEHIFEPFFTTKGPAEGTGLGLSMVFGIVKSHGGHITCQSEPGAGTTFKIYLPVLPGKVAPDLTMTMEIPVLGNETILLVEDEQEIRELGKELLSLAGYNVLTATNGKEALDAYRKEKEKISLIILDWIMPGIGGHQCLRELLEIDPKARVLVSSGYAAKEIIKESVDLGSRGFISKPYNTKQLLTEVRRILDTG